MIRGEKRLAGPGEERAVWRGHLARTATLSQRRQLTEGAGRTDPRALLPPSPETCHSAPMAVGPDQWENTG